MIMTNSVPRASLVINHFIPNSTTVILFCHPQPTDPHLTLSPTVYYSHLIFLVKIKRNTSASLIRCRIGERSQRHMISINLECSQTDIKRSLASPKAKAFESKDDFQSLLKTIHKRSQDQIPRDQGKD